MSVIIFSQSLKNEGISPFSIDGKFQPSHEKINLRTKFFKNLEKVKFKENVPEEVQSARLLSNGNIFIFKIYCNQKDNVGRFSPILIQTENSDLKNGKVQEYLEIFLNDCKNKEGEKRTISVDIKKKFEAKIEKYKNMQKNVNSKTNTTTWVIFGAVCLIIGGIIHRLGKQGLKNV